MSKQIYVISCENNKFYVGKSADPQERYAAHCGGSGSEWTKVHRPIKMVEVLDGADEDAVVIKYMQQHGIENVRGGSFSQFDISGHVPTIQLMMRSRADSCFKCGSTGHFATDCTVATRATEYIRSSQPQLRSLIREQIEEAIYKHYLAEIQSKIGYGTGPGNAIYLEAVELFNSEYEDIMKNRAAEIESSAHQRAVAEAIEKIASAKAAKMVKAGVQPQKCVSAPAQTPDQAPAETPAHQNCTRCGRNNHVAEKCFAKTHLSGGAL